MYYLHTDTQLKGGNMINRHDLAYFFQEIWKAIAHELTSLSGGPFKGELDKLCDDLSAASVLLGVEPKREHCAKEIDKIQSDCHSLITRSGKRLSAELTKHLERIELMISTYKSANTESRKTELVSHFFGTTISKTSDDVKPTVRHDR